MPLYCLVLSLLVAGAVNIFHTFHDMLGGREHVLVGDGTKTLILDSFDGLQGRIAQALLDVRLYVTAPPVPIRQKDHVGIDLDDLLFGEELIALNIHLFLSVHHPR